jgi:voltage-gated potassium channel
MLLLLTLGLVTVSTTVLVHALGTAWWLRRLRRLRQRADSTDPVLGLSGLLSILVRTALILITLHVVEVFLWAVALRLVPDGGLASLEEAMYLSFVTFTTLGYGDILLQGPGRMLTGLESLNGVLLIGWSTALSFAVIQRSWERMQGPHAPRR